MWTRYVSATRAHRHTNPVEVRIAMPKKARRLADMHDNQFCKLMGPIVSAPILSV